MGILKKKKTQVAEDKKTEKVVKAAPKKQSTIISNAYKVLVRPIISEKSSRFEAEGKYTFLVNIKTNKVEVRKAVKALYGVTPNSVNIMNIEGKRKRFGKNMGRRSDYKKAIITVNKGEKLDVHVGL
jgi:large subunit ribosomal protein L23